MFNDMTAHDQVVLLPEQRVFFPVFNLEWLQTNAFKPSPGQHVRHLANAHRVKLNSINGARRRAIPEKSARAKPIVEDFFPGKREVQFGQY